MTARHVIGGLAIAWLAWVLYHQVVERHGATTLPRGETLVY